MSLNSMVLKLFMALLCGTVIGLEREISDKAAGLRTHILVCIGACIFGIIGMELKAAYPDVDILRLAQGLLIGIGFLGGGVIFRQDASIKGLTTAAGIWVMGGIGLSIGVGYYLIALLGTVFSFITIALFGKIEDRLKK